MRVKFIRGVDPKAAMGLGVFGEIKDAGYYGYDNYGNRPQKISDNELILILNSWKERIDDDYVFRVEDQSGEEVLMMHPDDMEGKSFIYGGAIYNIPET
jgi:hypothetical protein